MAVERAAGGSSLIDVLDRVLDKGIVIDAWVRVSLVGIDLITVEARVVVASIDTYLKYSEAVGAAAVGGPSHDRGAAPVRRARRRERGAARADRERRPRRPARAPARAPAHAASRDAFCSRRPGDPWQVSNDVAAGEDLVARDGDGARRVAARAARVLPRSQRRRRRVRAGQPRMARALRRREAVGLPGGRQRSRRARRASPATACPATTSISSPGR